MKHSTTNLIAAICIGAFIFTSCSNDIEEINEEAITTEESTAKNTTAQDRILDIDYSPAIDKFIVAVEKPRDAQGNAEIALYMSRPTTDKYMVNGWWKQWTHAHSVTTGPSANFVGTAWADNGKGIWLTEKNNRLRALTAASNNSQPRLRGGSAKRIGDLESYLDADYDVANDLFIVSGTVGSTAKTYYRIGDDHISNWTEIQSGAGSIENGLGDYKGAAWAHDGNFVYAFDYLHSDGRQHISLKFGSLRNGEPKFRAGTKVRFTDLKEFVDIDYNFNNDGTGEYFTITGKDEFGNLKSYFCRYDSNDSNSWKTWLPVAYSRSLEKHTQPAGDYFGSAWSADGGIMTAFKSYRNDKPSVTIGASQNRNPRFRPGRSAI